MDLLEILNINKKQLIPKASILKNLNKAEKELETIIDDFKEHKIFDAVYWKSIFISFKVEAGYQDVVHELQKLCEEYKRSPIPPSHLANIYKGFKQYEKAGEQFLIASERHSYWISLKL